MNHTYRIVFNQKLGTYQCVAEIAKNYDKSDNKNTGFKALAAGITMILGGQAFAIDYTQNTTISTNTNHSENINITNGATLTLTNQATLATTHANGKISITNSGKLHLENKTHLITDSFQATGDHTTITLKDGVSFQTKQGFTLGAGGAPVKMNIASGATLNLTGANIIGDNVSQGTDLTATKATIALNKNNHDDKFIIANNHSRAAVQLQNTNLTVNQPTIVGDGFDSLGYLSLIDSQVNINDKLILGDTGGGHLHALQNSTIKTKDIIIGKENPMSSLNIQNNSKAIVTGGIINNGEFDIQDNSTATVTDNVLVGQQGHGNLNINDSTLTAKKLVIGTGDNPNLASNGHVKLNNSKLTVAEDIIIGEGAQGKGTLYTNNSTINAKHIKVWQGNNTQSSHIMRLDDSNLKAATLMIGGKAGIAPLEAHLNNSTINITNQVSIDTINGQHNHKLELDQSTLTTPKIVVGNQGSGNLFIKDSTIHTKIIQRHPNAKPSSISLDNSTVNINQKAENFFDNFNHQQGNTVTINNQAIFNTSADVGFFDRAKIVGAGNFIKKGTGTLTLNANSKAWQGETHIDEGTLKISGDYNMNKDEVLAVRLLDQNTSGKLDVTGTANISQGVLKVKASDIVKTLTTGTNTQGEWREVVKAETLNTQFKTVNVVDNNGNAIANSPIKANYNTPNTVHLTIDGKDISSASSTSGGSTSGGSTSGGSTSGNPSIVPKNDGKFSKAINAVHHKNLHSLSQILDEVSTNPTHETRMLNTALTLGAANLKEAQYAQAVSELQPLFAGTVNQAINDNTDEMIRNIYDSYANRTQRSDYGNLNNKERHLWTKIIKNQSTQKHAQDSFGRLSNNQGMVAGLDQTFGQSNIGIALAHLSSSIQSHGHHTHHQASTKTTQGALYGSYRPSETLNIYGQIGLGHSKIKGERHITTLSNTIAKSQHKANTHQIGIGASYQIGNHKQNISPFAQIDYHQTHSHAYQEREAGVYNLAIPSSQQKNIRATLGAKIHQEIHPNLTLTGTLAGAMEYSKNNDTKANFAKVESTAFSLPQQNLGKHIGIVGIGTRYQLGNAHIFFDYQGQWRKNQQSHGGLLGIKIFF